MIDNSWHTFLPLGRERKRSNDLYGGHGRFSVPWKCWEEFMPLHRRSVMWLLLILSTSWLISPTRQLCHMCPLPSEHAVSWNALSSNHAWGLPVFRTGSSPINLPSRLPHTLMKQSASCSQVPARCVAHSRALLFQTEPQWHTMCHCTRHVSPCCETAYH